MSIFIRKGKRIGQLLLQEGEAVTRSCVPPRDEGYLSSSGGDGRKASLGFNSLR